MITHSLGSVAEAPAGAATAGRVCRVSDTDAASFQIVRRRLFGIAIECSEVQVKRMTWCRTPGSAGSGPAGSRIPGAPHGITDTHEEQLGADLLEFLNATNERAADESCHVHA